MQNSAADYYSLDKYLKAKFGTKVYKLSLNGGMTCPNRDGTLDTRGCIFCSAGGSGDFAAPFCHDVNKQIENAKIYVSKKYGADKFIAYFQAFTNTYAPVEYLKSIFYPALLRDDIVALSIATRPDCLPPDVITLLSELNKIKPVWIELGLQTIHPDSAEYIRRGYPLETYDEAIKNLRGNVDQIITHVILGLPNETRDDMLETVRYVASSGATGIKLQLLHVIENTDLARDYRDGKFKTLEMDEYIDLLCDCVKLLPRDMVIHRLTGDGPKKSLIAPLWSASKHTVMNTLIKTMVSRDVHQGSL